MSIAAIVLAAGASTRLGSPKQLIVLNGETLLDRAVRIAREAGCAPVVVVLGANADSIRKQCLLAETAVRIHERWAEGMSSSLRLGLSHIQHLEGAIVMTCDMPAVTPGHLKLLMSTEALRASRYADRNGVPAYFPSAAFPQLMTLQGDAGARMLLRSAAAIDLPGGELDIDTLQDLERMAQAFQV